MLSRSLRASPGQVAVELKLLQHAIDITTEAYAGDGPRRPCKDEYEVQPRWNILFAAAMPISGLSVDRRMRPEFYDAAYEEARGRDNRGLILMDVGAEYEHLSPMSPGRFRERQILAGTGDVYRAVYDAQEAAARR